MAKVTRDGHIIRPFKGKCPICKVPANTACKSWCNTIDPHDRLPQAHNRPSARVKQIKIQDGSGYEVS